MKKGQAITIKVQKSKMLQVGEEVSFEYCISRDSSDLENAQIPWHHTQTSNKKTSKLSKQAKIVLAILVFIVVVVVIIKLSNNNSESQSQVPQQIPINQVQIANMQQMLVGPTSALQTELPAQFFYTANVTNNSTSIVQSISLDIDAYDCPGRTITPTCTQIGEDTNNELFVPDDYDGGIPPNQTRKVTTSPFEFPGLPSIQGNFLMSEKVTKINPLYNPYAAVQAAIARLNETGSQAPAQPAAPQRQSFLQKAKSTVKTFFEHIFQPHLFHTNN